MNDAENMREAIPCGACGNSDPQKRCIGCLHDFGTPESAWVCKYADALPLPPQPPLANDVVEMAEWVRNLATILRPVIHGVTIQKIRDAAALIERLAREKAETEAAVWEAEGKLSDATARAEQAEAEINTLMDANYRQAMCISFTAGALGPDISGTIDGLPKAARHVLNRAEKAEADLLAVFQREAESQRRHDARVEALEAEVDRLREAILKITEWMDPDFAEDKASLEIARAALTPKGADHE